MKNKIEDLRNHLFATLEALQDKEDPMDIDRAKAVADVAQTLIESAKVEVKFMEITGSTNGSGFIPAAPRENTLPAPVSKLVRNS
ncbi:hypothetical protein DJ031_06800 [bacterium endosymbiont of Escarpia laminata]|nr:MAG: hypothetical protein DJ031_06800 [bacterium endosymbiont of Escarpia laminata]